MRLNKNLVQNSLVLLLLTLGIEQASATLYCNRAYTELTQNPGSPYNAVGYLNNGCTAFLTDPDHKNQKQNQKCQRRLKYST